MRSAKRCISAALSVLLVCATAIAQDAPKRVERIVVLKVDGLPQRILDRYARPDATGHMRLGWIHEVFGRNGVWMENFYTRGISLSAPSWSLIETGQHLVIHGNVEYDRYTLRPWDYLNFFPFYVTYAASKHADMPGVELLDQTGVPLLIDRFPYEQRYQSFQLLQRGVRWSTLESTLKHEFAARPLKDLFDEWLRANRPDRAEKVLSLVRQLRGGALYQAEFGLRMKGEGPIAQLLGARFSAAVKRLGLNRVRYRLDTQRFAVPESARTALVDARRDSRQMRLL